MYATAILCGTFPVLIILMSMFQTYSTRTLQVYQSDEAHNVQWA